MKLRLIKNFRYCNLPPEGVDEVGWRTKITESEDSRDQEVRILKGSPKCSFKSPNIATGVTL